MASLQNFIAVSRLRATLENQRLLSLLDRSSGMLRPLSDPLADDFGLNRWLRGEREEAYSDWLAWILSQLRTPDRILTVFGDAMPNDTWRQQPASVVREYWVESGHVERTGRVDIHLTFQNHAVIWIEVKLTSAEEADMEKNVGYRTSQDARAELVKRRFSIATRGRQKDYGGFEFRSWATVCAGLRSAALGMLRSAEIRAAGEPRHAQEGAGSISVAAMTLAFVGAVEQNVLNFPTFLRQRALSGATIWTSAEIADHLESWLLANEEKGNV